MGEMTTFTCGGTEYEGYLASPVTGSGPGVIVLQEWWGLVGHIKAVADRFATAGFVALAPDLYGGRTTDEPDEAGSMLMALNIAETERLLACAIERLIDDPSTRGDKVGVVGFCMGGQLSLFAACANPGRVGACVDFYGIHPNVHPRLEALECPLLGIFAEHDEYASPTAVGALSEQLGALGKPHEFVTYPGVHHAFFNDDRPEVYDAAAAEDAWNRVVRFLTSNLC